MALLALMIWNSGATRPCCVIGPGGLCVGQEEVEHAGRVHRVLQVIERELIERVVARRRTRR